MAHEKWGSHGPTVGSEWPRDGGSPCASPGSEPDARSRLSGRGTSCPVL